MATRQVWPDLAVPPGEFLAETLEAMGMSQASLARQTGRPVQAINEIVHGKKAITAETALQFEQVLQIPAHILTRLEADYQLTKARLEAQRTRRVEANAVREPVFSSKYSPAPTPSLTGALKRARLYTKKKRAAKR